MGDHVFLCGLSDTQLANYGPGRELNLHGPKKNVRLKLDDVRSTLLNVESEDLVTDLAEIAVYVFAADCAVPRGGPTFPRAGADWRRTFRFMVAVRNPVMWREPERLAALREVLQFLSDDAWHFDFVEMSDPPPIQGYLGLATGDVDRIGDSSILLFSGGLDSYAGAVHELNTTNQHIVLVSRRVGGLTDEYQRNLATDLKKRHRRRITHVRVDAGLTAETEATEHTQRTRSFLFAAIAIVAAAIEQTHRVRFYENGVMSVNLPIASEVVGTRASRSTHPRTLLLLNQLVRRVSDAGMTIDNPFIWKTKVEVIQDLMKLPDRESIRYTLSCSHTRGITRYKTHCGKCAQCIQRRISTLGGGAGDHDPESAYNIELLTGARQDGEERQMAMGIVSAARLYRSLSEAGFATAFAGEFGWLTTSFPGIAPAEVARRFIAMFKSHGEAVRDVFVRAIEENAAALNDDTLPESCLLRTWRVSTTHDVPKTLSLSSEVTIAERALVDEMQAPEPPTILLALEEKRQLVLIDGIAPIEGATNFRIVSVLAKLYREDREAGRRPENYRSISASELSHLASSTGDAAGRQLVSRLRKRIEAEFAKLAQSISQDAVVENVHGKGYRLNPNVRIVDPKELLGR